MVEYNNNDEDDVCYWDWDEDLQIRVSDCLCNFSECPEVCGGVCPECGDKIIEVC